MLLFSSRGGSLLIFFVVLTALLAGCNAYQQNNVTAAPVDIRASAPPNASLADGRVILVGPQTGDVYINLNKDDRIRPGMQFNCFDPRTGVTVDFERLGKGNGTIEVVEVSDASALCRIVSVTKGRAIGPHDLIANSVYHNERYRPFRFVIAGDFDLNNDGITTADERERVIRLIIAWGGQVDDTVTAKTDYLVVGTRPASPQLQDVLLRNTRGSTLFQRDIDQADYDALITTARRYAVPVFNTNRLLAFIGRN
ncbi:MAG TPA: hypothetical protein VGN88_06110 [Phycisphaerae bacterium]|jgi:hypothetical protein